MASAPPGPSGQPAPAAAPIDLTPFAEIVGDARTDDEQGLTTGLVATSNDGQPDVALKGSLIVWDKDHIAWWERAKRETLAALEVNPRVAIFVRNPTRDRRTLRFYGTAEVVEDLELRERVAASIKPTFEQGVAFLAAGDDTKAELAFKKAIEPESDSTAPLPGQGR